MVWLNLGEALATDQRHTVLGLLLLFLLRDRHAVFFEEVVAFFEEEEEEEEMAILFRGSALVALWKQEVSEISSMAGTNVVKWSEAACRSMVASSFQH